MPTPVFLAGLNGTGKTTFINGFLWERTEKSPFVDWEAVARSHARLRLTGELPVFAT